MSEKSRGIMKSIQKKTTDKVQGYYFRKNQEQKYKNAQQLEVKSFRNIKSTRKFLNQSYETEDHQKQISFLKFIPATTKNFTSGVNKNFKDIKFPSFFKKGSKNRQINQTINNSNFQTIRQLNKGLNKKTNEFSLNGSFKYLQNSKSKQITNFDIQSTEENKLDGKINYLLIKINEMKGTLDRKREEKVKFLQSQRKQRKTFIGYEDHSSIFTNSSTPLKHFITQVPQHKDLHAFAHNPYSPKHSIYYVSEIIRAYKQQKSLARQHILCSIEYLRMFKDFKLPSDKQIQHMKVNLDRMTGYEDKKTVIFDLDETLIHCNENTNLPSDFKIKISFPTGQIIQVGINVRPFARQILAALYKNFQIIVFTASHSSYANVVLDRLDPQRKYIQHRLFRENCYCTSQGIYVKDLRIINRPLQKMILIDNAAYSYAFQPLNGVPIIPYYEGKNDFELQALLKYIQTLIFSVDVRQKNKVTFKLDQYHRFDELNTLVETLYFNHHN